MDHTVVTAAVITEADRLLAEGLDHATIAAQLGITEYVVGVVANDKLGASGQLLGTGELNLWILQDGFWLERMEFSTSDPSAGAAAIRIVFSNFNKVPAIDIPPDRQIFMGSPSPSTAP